MVCGRRVTTTFGNKELHPSYIEVNLLNRDEAITFIKELLYTFVELEGRSFAIMPPDADNVLSAGYQVHLKSELPDALVVAIKRYIVSRQLVMAQEKKNLIVIYRPLKVQGKE